jgi:translation initiation factor 1
MSNNARTVYTTETGRICPDCGQPIAACRCEQRRTRPIGDGIVRIFLDRKGRGGKTVSLVTSLPGSDEELKALSTELKRLCGTGGTLKDGVIVIQGDHRDALIAALQSKGIHAKKAGGK